MGFCTALFSQSVPSEGLAPLTHFGKLSLPIAAQQPSPVGHKSESLVPKESLVSLCPLFPSKLRGEPRNLPSPALPCSCTATAGHVPGAGPQGHNRGSGTLRAHRLPSCSFCPAEGQQLQENVLESSGKGAGDFQRRDTEH